MPKLHELKTWTNTGPNRKAHTIIFTEMEDESIIEIKHPSGNKSLITKTHARTLWNEYVDRGWTPSKRIVKSEQ